MYFWRKNKYAIRGLGAFLFICLLLILFFWPKSGMDYQLLRPNLIDSIRIVSTRNVREKWVLNRNEIAEISAQLKKSNLIHPEMKKDNDELFQLHFYSQGAVYRLSLINSYWNGKIIRGNSFYYKNDSLFSIVKNYYRP